MIVNRIRIETCTLNVSFVLRKKEKILSFLRAFSFCFKASPLWNSRCTDLKNTEISKLITPRGAVMRRQWIIGINMRNLPRQRGGSNDMPPFTSHQIWVVSMNTGIWSYLQRTVRKSCGQAFIVGTSSHIPPSVTREDWMAFRRLVYACAVLGLTTLCCDAWMRGCPVTREYVFVLNCVSVLSSIYLGQ